jgi:transposase-like protein
LRNSKNRRKFFDEKDALLEAGRKVADLAREPGVSEATIYTWKSKFGGLEVSEARRLKDLEDENRRLGGGDEG